jgi:hypothetical protein
MYGTKTILLSAAGAYHIEVYNSGGGIFWGGIFRDTLHKAGDTLIGNRVSIFFRNGKYYIKYAGEKPRKANFQSLDTCDFRVNDVRNWHYKESLRYRLSDTMERYLGSDDSYSNRFRPGLLRTNEPWIVYCHSRYRILADSAYDNSLEQIRKEYLNKEKRYNSYFSNTEVDTLFGRNFLKDFTSCLFDQKIFYDLLVNHTSLVLRELNSFNDAEYGRITTQIIYMPAELDKNKAAEKIKASPEQYKVKARLLKDIKAYWD